MKTAVDTSVLIAIGKGDPTAQAWVDLLADARSDGELVICDVVAAELAALLGMQGAFVASCAISGSPSARCRSRPHNGLAASFALIVIKAARGNLSCRIS